MWIALRVGPDLSVGGENDGALAFLQAMGQQGGQLLVVGIEKRKVAHADRGRRKQRNGVCHHILRIGMKKFCALRTLCSFRLTLLDKRARMVYNVCKFIMAHYAQSIQRKAKVTLWQKTTKKW
jgi:hypothetical protein